MDLERLTFGCRGLRISCWIVGIPVFPRFATHVFARICVRLRFSALRVRKRKNRKRSHSEVNVAVGIQRIGAANSPDLDHYSTEFDVREGPGAEIARRIGGVATGVNSPNPDTTTLTSKCGNAVAARGTCALWHGKSSGPGK